MGRFELSSCVRGSWRSARGQRFFTRKALKEFLHALPQLRLASLPLLTLPYHGSRITDQSDDRSMSVVRDTRREVGHHRHSFYL